MDPSDEDRPIQGEHVRPSLKAGIRMYLVVFLGTTYCMYRMDNFWTESVSADSTGTDALNVEKVTCTDGYGGLVVAIDDDANVKSECWMHTKSTECTRSTAKHGGPCAMNAKEMDVLCIRFCPADELASMVTFTRTDIGFSWESTFKMKLCASKDVELISELVSKKLGKAFILAKPDGVQFGQRIELHGTCVNFNFHYFKNLKFQESFKVMQALGNGSSGMVHLCLSMLDSKKYAVKIGTPRHGEYKEPSEVQALSVLNHSNIIDMPCAWNEKTSSTMSVTYIVMECCDRSVTSTLPLPSVEMNRKEDLFEQLVHSIFYLHEKGVIHRDIKPDNVLLLNNVLKLADFGQAILRSASDAPYHGGKYGSRGYTAPELTVLFLMHTEKVDVYGAGIFYYIIHSPRSGDISKSITDLMDFSNKVSKGKLHMGDPLFDNWGGDYDLLQVMVERDPEKRISAPALLELLVSRKSQG